MTTQQAQGTRERVLELTLNKVTPRQIAGILGISVQRVHQQLKRLRELGQLPPKDAA
jgi:predicted ArsR family transcriptional regulator